MNINGQCVAIFNLDNEYCLEIYLHNKNWTQITFNYLHDLEYCITSDNNSVFNSDACHQYSINNCYFTEFSHQTSLHVHPERKHLTMSRSPMYVTSACHLCMSSVYLICLCPLCMSHVYVPCVCPMCMSPVYVPCVCPLCMSPVYVTYSFITCKAKLVLYSPCWSMPAP